MEKIYVTVRPRPLSLEDAKTSIWRISGNSISISNQSTKFEFDQIFREDCKNVEVYEARTKDIVLAAVGGFNGTVFAYGQTSSGKTHTMRGSTVEPGVIPLAVRDLFHIIQEDVDREFLLRMSYMEIYNEEVNDLLAPEHRKLQIHESIERGIFVAGLREEIVATPEQVLDLMEFGESHRHIGETNMNVYSSRSHTIFRMIIESRVITEDDGVGSSCDAVRVSVLNLVDLAGSERAAKTGAEGVRLKEGSHINKSLMTLGTVIKRLSEGAESQGGHVPYRDSKLTRILQPSLGGNANTAIICNITLAQIHADETKSSLQFASRALRVTNCARVNEILTDAALLKRQKREIEELQAKLQGSRSEHFEEEILNLRNTLLQSELERERIALELQEEKKAQALRERRLQEQDKKIKNLSSMVLNSNVDEKRFTYKKDKRRDTWCPSAILRETLEEASLTTQWKASIGEPVRPERDMGLPCPFEELVNENEVSRDIPQDSNNDLSEDCILPDARSLLNVTNRRKTYMKKKNSLENHELLEMKEECEDLFLEETQRKAKDIEIGFLTEQLVDTEHHSDGRNIDFSKCQLDKSALHGDKSLTLRESEAILVIKQLQEQVKMLEKEKTSIQQCLDNVIELATEQNLSAKEKYEEVFQELLDARKATKVVDESLPLEASTKTIEEDYVDSTMELLMEVQGIEMEVQSSRNAVECVSSVVDELFQSFSVASNDLKSFICQNSAQLKSIISDNEKIHSCMRKKVDDLENDKSVLHNQSIDLHKQIQELRLNLQESEKILMERCQQHDLEKAEFLSEFGNLEKEISCLSSCSLAKEKETLRKELEKTKVKLKETESKLRTVIQEKTKLESEKAQAEREIKHLHGQKNLLERDICKRDSLAGRRRESKAFDSNKTKGHAGQSEQIVQGEYKKLEVLAFEMETTIASLEEDLAAVNVEKEEAFCRNEILSSELESTLDKLSTTNLELKMLQEEVSSMKIRLDESESLCQKMEISIKLLSDEKEELAMKLTDALLELDEEKAIWSAKEKASIESITEKVKLSNAEITLLSKEISEVRDALESCREESKVLRERLNLSEENAEWERKCSMEKSSEIDQLRHDLKTSESECEKCEDILKSKSEMLELEHRRACDEMDKLQKELCVLNKERDDLLLQIKEMDGGLNHSTNFEDLKNQLLIMSKERDQLLRQYEEQQKLMIEVEILKKENDDLLGKARAEVEELKRRISSREIKIHNDTIDTNNEKAKLKMRLRSTQAKLDAFRGRYRETIDEMGLMNRKYDEASAKLKEQLASYGREVLHLKKQLAMKG